MATIGNVKLLFPEYQLTLTNIYQNTSWITTIDQNTEELYAMSRILNNLTNFVRLNNKLCIIIYLL